MPNNKAIAYFWTTKDEIVGGMYFKLVLIHTKACCNIYETLLGQLAVVHRITAHAPVWPLQNVHMYI